MHQISTVTTSDQLAEIADVYSQVDEFVFDVETWGEHRANTVINNVVWISLATHGRVDVIPMGHPHGEYKGIEYPLTATGERRKAAGLSIRKNDYSADLRKATLLWEPAPDQLSPSEVFAALKPVFFGGAVKAGHNVKFDLKSITKYYGAIPEPPYADTMVAAFLLDSRNAHRKGLADCLERELGFKMAKGVGAQVEAHAFSVVAKYSALDARYTWLLWRTLSHQLSEQKMQKLFALEMDVTGALLSMELTGALMDVDSLAELKDVLTEELDKVVGDIYREAGSIFNINSNAEKQRLLYSGKRLGGRGLKPTHLTANGKLKRKAGQQVSLSDYSVAEDALRQHESDPLVALLLKHSELKKMLSTYVIPYLGGDVERTTNGKTKTETKKALLINGRIHGEFDQIGAETGRFSSRNPNLQNVPNPRSELGKKIRNLWIAGPGSLLVVADYSQIEPRVTASFSQDPVMLGAYQNGEDLYAAIGAQMGVNRDAGKVLVLSMSYGVGPDNIAAQIGCTVQEAEKLLKNFERKFPALTAYKRQVVSDARNAQPVPFVETLMKRRRYLPDLLSRLRVFRSRAERQAFNTKIQGSAADIIKVAMVRAHAMIPEQARMILTVHDEIVTSCPADLADDTAEAIRQAMEGIHVLKVPLIADVKVVDKWGAAK